MFIAALLLTAFVGFYTTMVRVARQIETMDVATHPGMPAPVLVEASPVCEVINLPWVRDDVSDEDDGYQVERKAA